MMRIPVRWLFVVAFLPFLGQVAAADDIETLRKQRDVLLQHVIELTATADQLQTENAKLRESNARLRARLAYGTKETTVPDLPRIEEFDRWWDESLEGVVTAVSLRFIEASVGSDDGVREGMTFQLFRDERHLGTAIVRKVAATRSVLEMKPDALDKVRKGDRILSPDVSIDTKRKVELEERRQQLIDGTTFRSFGNE